MKTKLIGKLAHLPGCEPFPVVSDMKPGKFYPGDTRGDVYVMTDSSAFNISPASLSDPQPEHQPEIRKLIARYENEETVFLTADKPTTPGSNHATTNHRKEVSPRPRQDHLLGKARTPGSKQTRRVPGSRNPAHPEASPGDRRPGEKDRDHDPDAAQV